MDFSQGEGLEFGPLNRPIVRRPAAQVYYADHVSTAELRTKYALDPNVAVDDLASIDIVWPSGPLREAVQRSVPGPQKWFQFIIASHVIEHVPDIVWWLAELRSVMSSGGDLRLIVPDRRFTMDIGRQESVLADAMAAYMLEVRRPEPREITDFYSNYRKVDAVEAWRGDVPDAEWHTEQRCATALRLAGSAVAGNYHDVHCGVFTPLSFVRQMSQLADLGMIWFECRRIFTTVEGEIDFFVHMGAADDRSSIARSWQAACDSMTRIALNERHLPQSEACVLRNTIKRQDMLLEQLRRDLAAASLRHRLLNAARKIGLRRKY
jgi:ubiquinone/menaquinone biosynthesis C-methylase UbiE